MLRIVDKLVSKRIPAAARLATLSHIATGASRLDRYRPAATLSHPPSKAVKPAMSTDPMQTRTYTGTMLLGGTFSDTVGQTGTWSGVLHEQLIVTTDANGNGTGYEIFQGSLGAVVKNPDGSTKSIPAAPLTFTFPTFTISGGHFSTSQNSGDFSGLMVTVTVSGTLNTTQPTASETLKMPFDGFVQGVLFTGSVNGSASLSTPPLALSGTAARQHAYGAMKMSPFQNLVVTDLNGVPVTATVIMSNPTHGTLTNLGGGTYNRTTGVYTITGSGATINAALNGLEFDPNGKLGSVAFPTPTGFTLRITDSKGGSLVDKTTSVLSADPLSITGAVAYQAVRTTKTIAPFRTVAISDLLGSETDYVKITLSNAANGTLTNLGGGFYNKKTGTYFVHGTAGDVTTAVRGLVFDPSGTAGQATSFTITVTNAAGASATNGRTSVTSKRTVALFSQYVAAGLHGMPDHAAGLQAFHELPAASHPPLAAGHG